MFVKGINMHMVIALQWNMIKMNLDNLNHGFEQKFFGEKIIWLYMYSAKILNIFNSSNCSVGFTVFCNAIVMFLS